MNVTPVVVRVIRYRTKIVMVYQNYDGTVGEHWTSYRTKIVMVYQA